MRHILLLFTLCTVLVADAKDKSRFAYSYHRGTAGNVSMMHGELNEFLRYQKKLGPGRFLWARLDGREYVVRDQAELDRLDAAFAPTDALNREMEKLRREMKPVERRYDRLEEELDDLTDRDSDDGDLTSAEKARMRELREQVRAARNELRPFEQRERALEDREEEIDKRVDAAVEDFVKRAIRNGTAERFRY